MEFLLDSHSSFLEKNQRKKMDKMWLMWVIAFKIFTNIVLSSSFYRFSLALWETNLFGNLNLLKIFRLQPTLSKEQGHRYGFSQAQKEVLNLNYTKLSLIWLTYYFKPD